VTGATKQPAQSIEQMTTFKPFNIKELDFDIWEGKPKASSTIKTTGTASNAVAATSGTNGGLT